MKLIELNDLPIQLIDGDRGVNYPSKSEFSKNGYCAFLNTGNVSKMGFDFSNIEFINKERDLLLRKGKLQYNDIVLTTRGTIGNVGFYNPKILYEHIRINSGMIIMRCDESLINPYYLYLFLRSELFKKQVLSQGSGSAQPQLPIGSLKNISFPFTNILNQQKIVKVLSDIDSKIELNNKINSELEAMAKTLYDYWFVQFDFADANGKPYKTFGGKMVWNEDLKREIPEGWEVDNLLNVSNITTGKLDSNAEVVNGKYYFYTCSSTPTKTDSYAFDNSVILIAGNNAAGNFHVNRYTGKFNAYQRTYIVTANEEEYLDYLYQVLFRQMKVLKTRGNGSQTKFLTIGMLNSISIFRPNLNLMSEFSKLTIPMYEKQVNLMKENQQLASLRDWLLPMLMNGQVRVGDVEEELGMVAEPEVEYGKE